MERPRYITEEDARRSLSWDSLVPLIESGLGDSSKHDGSVIHPPRLIMPVPQKKGVLLSMPGFSESENALGCKLVTSFTENRNKNLPSILATVLLFNPETGKLKAIIEGTEITGWRTAAASVVATMHMHKGPKNRLAVLGAGTQGRMHILALQHKFGFKEVRIWNRTPERGQKLARSFGNDGVYKFFSNNRECVEDADVVCTCTYATEPILHWEWLKRGAHVNAVGGAITHHSELEEEIYNKSLIVVDSIDSARNELKDLIERGVSIWGDVGEIINKTKILPQSSSTVFHSFGLAIEDVLTANLIYNSST